MGNQLILFDIGITFLAIVGNVFIGLLTYFKNPKSHTNRLFFYLAVTIALYLFSNYQSLHQTTAALTLFWVRVAMGFAVGINLLFFLFVTVFPQLHISMKKNTIWISSGITILLFCLLQTNFIFSSFDIKTSQPNPGPGIPLFLLHTLLLLGRGIVRLILKLRQARGIQRKQLWYVFLGALLMFSAIIISNVIFVLVFKVSTFVGLLPLYTLIFVGFVAYAIIRHRLLDIRSIVARSVTYTLLVSFLGLIYSLGIFFVRYVLLGANITQTELVSSSILALIIAVSFQPFLRVFDKITRRLFFRGGYDLHIVLPRLNRIITSTILLKDLTQLVLVELETYLKMSGGHIVIFDKQKIAWKQSLNPHEEIDDSFLLNIVKSKLFDINKKIIVFEELEEGDLKEAMRKEKVNIIMPLFTKDELIGGMFLGEKSSGQIYSVQDIETLQIIGPELSVGMKNALSYHEIKRFNQTLKEEIEKATADLKIANKQLQELDKLKDEFVSVASHELRTPLTAIRSYLWMALKGKGGALTEKQQYYLDRSYNSTIRLINLVNDMLNTSRIESGRMKFEIKKTNVGDLIKTVIEEVIPRANELGITIKLDQIKNEVFALMDKDKIHEVLINLIGNSLKFTPRGGTITVSCSEKDGKVTVDVTDTGSGLDPEDIPRLFQKFGMIEGSYATNQLAAQGTGLGLYICKSIIEKHQGTIRVISPGKNKGSTFSFTLFSYSVAKEHEFNQAVATGGLDIIHSEFK